MKSLYIHIPFCNHICTYCDFCKHLYSYSNVLKYLNQLEEEVKDRYNNEVLDTIYIGGGTPSVLNMEELRKLFNIISLIKLNKNYEFTFECNVNDISEELIKILKD